MADILYTIAVDKNNQFVNANDAKKGEIFSCPVCKTELILRKSGSKKKGAKRPHFAHKTAHNCKPESYLHYIFKTFLADKLKALISKNVSFQFTWECLLCEQEHSEDLLKGIKTIEVEYYLNICRPDIALLNEKGKIVTAIEIVVTSPPKERVLEYYKNEKINFIQIDVNSEQDIEEIKTKMEKPTKVNYHSKNKCTKFILNNDQSDGNNLSTTEITQITDSNTHPNSPDFLFNTLDNSLNGICSQCKSMQPTKNLYLIEVPC